MLDGLTTSLPPTANSEERELAAEADWIEERWFTAGPITIEGDMRIGQALDRMARGAIKGSDLIGKLTGVLNPNGSSLWADPKWDVLPLNPPKFSTPVVHRDETAPNSREIGDLWFKPSENKTWYWSGSDWLPSASTWQTQEDDTA